MKKCSECGTKMIADRDRIYLTYPPRYLFKCPNCGNTEYGLCSDVDTYEDVAKRSVEYANALITELKKL